MKNTPTKKTTDPKKQDSSTEHSSDEATVPTTTIVPSKRLTLPEAITIDNIEEIFAQAQQLDMTTAEPIVIDASQANLITTPGIQLLLSIEKSIAGAGGSITITQTNDSFRQSFETLGLHKKITQWEAKNG